MSCKGFGIICSNTANQGFDYCDKCFVVLKSYSDAGFCISKHGTCKNPKNGIYSWCKVCHLEKKVENEKKKAEEAAKFHDCSYRGGVACSVCDDIWKTYDELKCAFSKARRQMTRTQTSGQYI